MNMTTELLKRLSAGYPNDEMLREAADEILGQSEDVILQFTVDYARVQLVNALKIASRTLSTGHAFATLLTHGIRTADANSMRFWIEVCAPRVGNRRVVSILRNLVDECPVQVQKALYWAKATIGDNDSVAGSALKEIEIALRSKTSKDGSNVE